MTDPLREALMPCPFCKHDVQFRKALWPSDGNADAIIHTESSNCGLVEFSDGSIDESIVSKWNTRAALAAPQPNPITTDMSTRDEIEAGSDLTDEEIEACKMHLRAKMKLQGSLRGCISYCQRNMGIGWSHALRIVEYLEACGIVTTAGAAGDRDPGPNWDR